MHVSPSDRIAGVLVPMFAMRGRDDLGIGDVRALRELVDWCAKTGLRLINLLPLNEPGTDPSPYNPISAIAIDPLTISLVPEDFEDVTATDYQHIRREVKKRGLTTGPVRYRDVRELKLSLLGNAFTRFESKNLRRKTKRAAEFERFTREESPWLRPYALFRALMDRHGHERWTEWPDGHRTAEKAEEWLAALPAKESAQVARRMEYHSYVQWIALQQWEETHRYAEERGVALMGDIPLGVSFYGADVFASPELFNLTWSSGAPPDAMSVGAPQEFGGTDLFRWRWGQNWGFPIYDWQAMRRDGLLWWRRRVSRLRSLVDLFRIDHILGFYRIYAFPWRPEKNDDFLNLSHDEARGRTGGELPRFLPRADDSAYNCGANCAEGESLLRILLEEAGPDTLIGEDLGCVPDYVRPNLAHLGIAGYKVPIWEPSGNGDRLIPGADYPRLSVAMYVTHDHAPLKAQWDEWAAAIRAGGGHAADVARRSMWQLLGFAGWPGNIEPPLDYTEEVHRALIEGLLRSNSWIAIFLITDLYARDERFNVPGAFGEDNWTQRMHVPIADLDAEPQTAWIRKLLAETGRAEAVALK